MFRDSALRLIACIEGLQAILYRSWETELTPEEKKKVTALREMGLKELAQIDDILDKHAQREKSWGGSTVDMFRAVLNMDSPGMGTALFCHAVRELRLAVARIERLREHGT